MVVGVVVVDVKVGLAVAGLWAVRATASSTVSVFARAARVPVVGFVS